MKTRRGKRDLCDQRPITALQEPWNPWMAKVKVFENNGLAVTCNMMAVTVIAKMMIMMKIMDTVWL